MDMRQLIRLFLTLVTAGCTSFSTVRSARVTPGLSGTIQASVASPPGDDAAWFWSFDCADQCNHAILGTDVVLAYGSRWKGGRVLTIGGGVTGFEPYVEAYTELSADRNLGIGARTGLPRLGSWTTRQVYLRSDWSLNHEYRFLWNPGIVHHSGRSPNGENPGSFLGVVNGFGIEAGAGPMTVTPSASLVWGRSQRNSYGEQFGPTHSLFVTAALSMGFRRGPSR